MADQKITDLVEDTDPQGEDFIVTAKSPFGAGSNRKVSLTSLGQNLIINAANVLDIQILATFTNTAGTQLKGSILDNFSLNWTYNRAPDPTSQSINNGIGSVATSLRTYAVSGAGLTSTTTYTITAVGDDGTNSNLSSTIQFLNRRYYGVSQSLLTTDTEIKAALSAEFASSRQTTKTLNAAVSGGNNYLYIAYPKAFGLPSSTLFGGFTFTDYTLFEIAGFTNSAGFSEDYYVLRTNGQYSSAALTWQIL